MCFFTPQLPPSSHRSLATDGGSEPNIEQLLWPSPTCYYYTVTIHRPRLCRASYINEQMSKQTYKKTVSYQLLVYNINPEMILSYIWLLLLVHHMSYLITKHTSCERQWSPVSAIAYQWAVLTYHHGTINATLDVDRWAHVRQVDCLCNIIYLVTWQTQPACTINVTTITTIITNNNLCSLNISLLCMYRLKLGMLNSCLELLNITHQPPTSAHVILILTGFKNWTTSRPSSWWPFIFQSPDEQYENPDHWQ